MASGAGCEARQVMQRAARQGREVGQVSARGTIRIDNYDDDTRSSDRVNPAGFALPIALAMADSGISQESGVALIVFLAANTGALIFFAGSVTATLKSFGERITAVEDRAGDAIKDVAYLRGKEDSE